MIRKKVLGALLLAGSAVLSAAAEANPAYDVDRRIAPPPFVPAHVSRHGYVWAPGYWAWDGYRYVWVEGRWMMPRPRYFHPAPRAHHHPGWRVPKRRDTWPHDRSRGGLHR